MHFILTKNQDEKIHKLNIELSLTLTTRYSTISEQKQLGGQR